MQNLLSFVNTVVHIIDAVFIQGLGWTAAQTPVALSPQASQLWHNHTSVLNVKFFIYCLTLTEHK